MDFVIAVSYLFPCSLDYAKGDLSSVRSILYSVAKKIHQNFLYTEFVTVYIQIPDLPDINGKFLFLFQRLFPDDNIRLIDNIYDAAYGFLQFRLTAFNPTDLQHFIYNSKKMISRNPDFFQIVLYFCGIITCLDRKICKTKYCIHRGADVVRHILEEYFFGDGCLVCRTKGFFHFSREVVMR